MESSLRHKDKAFRNVFKGTVLVNSLMVGSMRCPCFHETSLINSISNRSFAVVSSLAKVTVQSDLYATITI